MLCDSSRHALAKPPREALFTRLSREQRYKSKAFIDAAAPVVVAWALLGRRLGRDEDG